MNDSRAQQAAQTPSPSTGSRQDTHSDGSAMSSASLAARDNTPWPAFHAERQALSRDGALLASMRGG
jgi:hypothetical protein